MPKSVDGHSLFETCAVATTPGVLPSESGASPAAHGRGLGGFASSSFLRKLSFVELWAGVAALSTCLLALTGKHPSAFCECDPLLHAFLSSKHPGAQTATMFELEQWRQWRFPAENSVVVMGGPSCVSLSTAGKQLAGRDPTSRYLFDHLLLGAFFAALLILLENVPWLIDGDEIHGLFTKLTQLGLSLGYTLTKVWRTSDYEVGGFTQRERVFLLFERTVNLQFLPASVPEAVKASTQRAMSDVLLPASRTPQTAWLEYTQLRRLPTAEIQQGQATKVAECVISWKGRETVRGALVRLHESVNRSGRQGINKCRVMGVRGVKIELRRADRKNPTFRLVYARQIKCGIVETISVYAKDGIGIGLRRWGEPPLNNAFAVLKRRDGQLQPCVIVPTESWRLHGLPEENRVLLEDMGATPEQVASAAGNCITMAMCEWVLASLLMRLREYEYYEPHLVLARCLAKPILSLESQARSVILLPVCTEGEPRCLVDPKQSRALLVPMWEPGRAHKPASSLAGKLASKLFGGLQEVILCGHFEGAIAFCLPMATMALLSPLEWCTSAEIGSESLQLLVSMAIVVAMSCCPPPQCSLGTPITSDDSDWVRAQRGLMEQSHLTGARAARLVQASKEPSGQSEAEFAAALAQDREAAELLRTAIVAETDLIREELKSSFAAWSDCIRPLPLADMPTDIHCDLETFEDEELLQVPIPNPCPVHQTEWLPRKQQPKPPRGFKPKVLTDLLLPWALKMISDWVTQQLLFLMDIAENGSNAVRTSNQPLALGQDAFVPEARGIVWDLRWLADGVIFPVDFDEPIESHLNLELLRQLLSDWPDQELVSFLLEGVRYKADLAYQIVLLPHLVSLRDGYGSLQAEVEKYASAGWYGLFSHPPFLPFRAVPKGSTPRKLEPERPRPTTEAGAPRKALVDTEGVPVVSINEASSGLTPESVIESGEQPRVRATEAWPKENKPTVGDVLQAMAFLLAVGAMLGETLFAAADDFKNFFNQLRCSPETFWYCGMMLSQGSEAIFCSEYIMTFGLRPASNIAQRFADAILAIWRDRMAKEEKSALQELADGCTRFAELLKNCPSLALAVGFIYTDDPIFIVLGHQRMARALRIWTTTCADIGLLMAIPAKRQCGTWVEWLGAGICSSMGFAWVPIGKRLTALSKLYTVLDGTITVDTYHSLLGLLEHLVYLQGMRRSLMYGLWAPFKQGIALEPNRLLQSTPTIRKQCKAWIRLLDANSAVSAMCMVYRIPMSLRTVVYTLSSDAFRSDSGLQAGLGGWCHGHYWSLQLTEGSTLYQAACMLPIAALEYIAAVVNVLTFSELLPDLDPTRHVLHARVDALATPFILTEDAASSPLMVRLHMATLRNQQFQQLAQLLAVSHVYGMSNELADAASRADTNRLRRLASQLRISPVELRPHSLCDTLLRVACEL